MAFSGQIERNVLQCSVLPNIAGFKSSTVDGQVVGAVNAGVTEIKLIQNQLFTAED